MGGKIQDYVTDASGRRQECDLAVASSSFSRGLGIKVDPTTGEVSFVYDKYGGFAGIAKQISDEIVQNYTRIALIRAMKSCGYNVREESGYEAGSVVIVGES